ncbi:alpha/beta hydrolase family protein [Mesoterricola silvestris]|uniref:Alpha/beta hydrolase n=1 Tax=Mesoterricola silvestris TaxID=2927979 RepID=A0AA48GKZ6_9BACT|nr:hypothetical protein [Mesoterricola silvestris]BDU71699.1 alpha/beta hydrolase [Mesoterricola silvestris]
MKRILLVHGWGFGPSLWEPLREALPGPRWFTLDLGYFGPARLELPPALDLVVGHSFGCLWALREPALDGVPLVAVNGFARFSAAADYPEGTPVRVLDRMLDRLQADPGGVLRAFHARLGTEPPPGEPDVARLRADLLRMRDEDARGLRQPVLALGAADDPLVPMAFGGRPWPTGGHVLPLTRPGDLARALPA